MSLWQPRIQQGSVVKYTGIVNAIEADIKDRLVKPGDKLPSQRAIAKQLNIDLSTVTRALNEAAKRGLVETLRGSGSYIAQTAFSYYNSTRLTEGKMIDLSMNNPPHPTTINLQDEIVRGIKEISDNGGLVHQLNYQETAGNPADREAAAVWLQQRIKNIEADQVLIASGAHSALFSILSLVKHRGNTVAAPALSYPGLRSIADNLGLDIIGIAIDEQGIVPEDFDRACQNHQPNALYLIPNIDNPTTVTLKQSRRLQIVAIARKFDVILIEDDPYTPFLEQPLPSIYSLAPERTWHIATLSKCISPALRVAYIISPEISQGLSLVEKIRTNNLMAPPLMTALVSHWIKNGRLNTISHAIKIENMARQAIAATIFNGLDFVTNSSGPHIWLKLPSNWRALEFAETALKSGISIVPSSSFVTDSMVVQAVRISMGGAIESQQLEKALTVLAQLIQQNKNRSNTIV